MDESLDCMDMERKYKPATWIPQAVHDELQAIADKRLELLRRALSQLKIHAPRQVPLIEDIEKELSDG